MQLSIIYEYGNINTVQELLKQMTNDVELIISTSRETRQLKELIKKAAESEQNKQIAVIKHSVKTSCAEYRKQAVMGAKGDYVAFVLSNDSVTSDYTEGLLKAVSEGGEYIPVLWELSDWHNTVFTGSNNLWAIFANCISINLAADFDYELTPEAAEKNKAKLDAAVQGQSTMSRIYYHRSK